MTQDARHIFSSLSIKLVSLYIPVCPPVRPTVCLYLFLSFGLTDLPVCLFVFQPVCTVWKKVRMKWNWVRMFGGAEKTCDAWPQHLGLDEDLSVGLFIVWLLCMTSALIHSKEVRYQIDDRFSCRCDCCPFGAHYQSAVTTQGSVSWEESGNIHIHPVFGSPSH